MNIVTMSVTRILVALVIVLAVIAAAAPVQATEWVDPTPTTASFTLYKYVIGDEQPDGEHTAIPEFTFHLDGPIDVSMKSGETVELPEGTYILTETGPEGYFLDFWGGDCDEADGTSDSEDAEVIVTAGDLVTNDTLSCQVYNEIGEGDGEPMNGTLIVNKVVTNDNGGTGLADDFFFKVNGGTSIAFEEDGSNSLSMPAGTYTVTEVMTAGYSTTYQDCTNIALTEGGTATCTITNNDIAGTTTPTTTPLYKIEGYVWHDANSNDAWEKDNNETEEVEPSESDLEGWTVTVTNGQTSQSTVTNADGYYSFMVPAGTWTITETVQSEWAQTFPNSGSHVVTVPAVVTKAPSFLAWFIATAHAQVPQVYGSFDFGNVFVGGSSTGGGGGGSSSGGGGSGGGKRISLSSSDSAKDTDKPQGEVKGAVAPIGAPNAGMGGAGTGAGAVTLLLALMLCAAIVSARRTA